MRVDNGVECRTADGLPLLLNLYEFKGQTTWLTPTLTLNMPLGAALHFFLFVNQPIMDLIQSTKFKVE